MTRSAVFIVATLLATSIGAQESKPSLSVSPQRPRAGSLFRVTLRAHGADHLVGHVGDEPLHFERVAPDTYVALAPVPVDARGTIRITASVGEGAPIERVVPIATANYPTERLTVAPGFGTKPDSALQRRIDAESSRAAEVARSSHETPRLWRGAFAAPRPGRITSGFGRARVFNGAVQSRHMGTDWAGAVGAPVKASNRGVVRIVDAFYYGGNVVYVDHGAGLVTAYLHLSVQSVVVGDTVEKGQVIGKVGQTGRVTGPHLHLIARYGSVTIDPVSVLAVTQKQAGIPHD